MTEARGVAIGRRAVTGGIGLTLASAGTATAITVTSGAVNADVKKINGVTIVGDGSGTPFNV